MKKKIIFEQTAFQDFTEWAGIDKKLYRRIVNLIKDIIREPYSGIGKPEALKHELSGYWSRRINGEHRLVYKVDDEFITIASCKYHYG
jgi:toxin YoeB